ncbi:MAG: hypothetical protein IJM90_05880 [Firmicutes bacterium]|nr:hypothetical protein [Bacillota bacterium]
MIKNKLLIIIVLLCVIALFLLFGRIPIPVSRISEGIQFTEDGRVSQATLTVKGIVWHHLISGIGDDRFTGSMSLTVDQKDILPEEYAKSSFNKQFFGPLTKYKSYYHSMVGFDWYDEGRNKMMNLMYYFSASAPSLSRIVFRMDPQTVTVFPAANVEEARAVLDGMGLD